MRIALVTPARPAQRSGNRNTALRWARLLRELGHDVAVQTQWNGRAADLMIALHARRSHASIVRFATALPQKPLIVALTGTDLYRDIRVDATARLSLALATRLIVLQELGVAALAPALRKKTRVIYQSTQPIARGAPLKSCFEVCVSGHLREEKDPFRTAAALQHLPAASRIRVTHMGAATTPEMAAAARAWMRREPRYRWVGELPYWLARRQLARSRIMVISSRMEGGANVVTEALAAGVPIIASRIPGNIGMLGRGYRGYYALEDEQQLARLLRRAESDAGFYQLLNRQCATRRKLVTPLRERAALQRLLREVVRLPAR